MIKAVARVLISHIGVPEFAASAPVSGFMLIWTLGGSDDGSSGWAPTSPVRVPKLSFSLPALTH